MFQFPQPCTPSARNPPFLAGLANCKGSGPSLPESKVIMQETGASQHRVSVGPREQPGNPEKVQKTQESLPKRSPTRRRSRPTERAPRAPAHVPYGKTCVVRAATGSEHCSRALPKRPKPAASRVHPEEFPLRGPCKGPYRTPRRSP